MSASNTELSEAARKQRINRIAKDLERLKQMRGDQSGDQETVGKVGVGYKFIKMIGEGAMSRVYLARRTSDSATLVLKLMDTRRRREDTLVKRFIREAQLISGLKSRYVVKVYDQGFTDNYGYIAMEYFPRGDLRSRTELNLPPYLALRYMAHLALGLAAIHSVGIIHRDLKPANLMFRRDDTLVLADFGISKRISEDQSEGQEELTMVGQVLGTPYYMSPEQGQGIEVDARADLYSAGIILYELLTGERPYRARTPAAIIYKHIHADLPKLPPKLHRFQPLINRLLAKDPQYRYESAKELAIQLQKAAGVKLF